MFGTSKGILGNNIHQGRAQEAELQADLANMRERKNADEWSKAYDNLRVEVNLLSQSEVDFFASIAGIRGVTRELLEELRKADPKNPLLDKKIRDRVFVSSYHQIGKKVTGTSHKQRNELKDKWRDESLGAAGAGLGGPEASQITPNLVVRAEAEVPSHISDREKFLSLIEQLSTELKKANPNATILKDKEMISVFEDYTLNEMERQSKSKP